MDVDTAGKQAAAYLTDVAKKRVVVRSKKVTIFLALRVFGATSDMHTHTGKE
jgi:hypothetical protein